MERSWATAGLLGLPVTVLYCEWFYWLYCNVLHMESMETHYSMFITTIFRTFLIENKVRLCVLDALFRDTHFASSTVLPDCSRFGGSNSWISQAPQRSICKRLCRVLPQLILEIASSWEAVANQGNK